MFLGLRWKKFIWSFILQMLMSNTIIIIINRTLWTTYLTWIYATLDKWFCSTVKEKWWITLHKSRFYWGIMNYFVLLCWVFGLKDWHYILRPSPTKIKVTYLWKLSLAQAAWDFSYFPSFPGESYRTTSESSDMVRFFFPSKLIIDNQNV
jgi:hypothetical protein